MQAHLFVAHEHQGCIRTCLYQFCTDPLRHLITICSSARSSHLEEAAHALPLPNLNSFLHTPPPQCLRLSACGAAPSICPHCAPPVSLTAAPVHCTVSHSTVCSGSVACVGYVKTVATALANRPSPKPMAGCSTRLSTHAYGLARTVKIALPESDRI